MNARKLIAPAAAAALLLVACGEEDVAPMSTTQLANHLIAKTSETSTPIDINTRKIPDSDTDDTSEPVSI